MKKFLAVLAIVGVLASCKDSKKEEPKTDDTTTTTTTEPTTTEPTTTTDEGSTTATEGVPTFSDPEVQKFANDYGAFMAEYKAGMNDPAKLVELSKNLKDWASKAQKIGMKLATNPTEAKLWADWTMKLSKSIMPGQ